MAFALNNIVVRQDIMNQFISVVRDSVLRGSLISRDNPSPYIDSSYLGRLSDITSVTSNALGENLQIIRGPGNSYGSIYGALTYMTKLLLKVGTWDYLKEDKGRYSDSQSGKCIFSDSVVINQFRVSSIASLPINPHSNGVEKFQPITLSSINGLINACLAAYNSSYKVNLSVVDSRCHANCHTDVTTKECHTNSYNGPDLASDWWGNPQCYHNGNSHGYPDGSPRPEHTNVGDTPTHKDSGSDENTCHTNYSRLSLKFGY